MSAVPPPGVPTLRPALPGVRRRGFLGHRVGHLHRRDETHLLRARRRNHAAPGSSRELQRESGVP